MKYTPRLPAHNDNISHESMVKELLILSGGVIGIVVGIYVLLGLAVNWIVPHISLETEEKIAVLFSGVTDQGEAASPQARYLQTLCDKLQAVCPEAPYDVTAHIIEYEKANAFAMPGGNILVSAGLIEKMESENELAYVLLHELGHFANRDHLKGLGRAIVFVAISTALLGPDNAISQLLASTIGVSELSSSRGQETAADEFALIKLQQVYGHVNGATDFFEKISASKDPGIFGHYFSTHPETIKRIEHIKAYAQGKDFPFGEKAALPDLFKEQAEPE